MNVERLNRLADFLDTIPPERFDMDIWASDVDCETAGCAMGWACQIPEFKAAGLHLESVRNNIFSRARPVFGEEEGIIAADGFFELDNYMLAEALFYTSAYRRDKDWLEYEGPPITPAEVAARIRRIVAHFPEES